VIERGFFTVRIVRAGLSLFIFTRAGLSKRLGGLLSAIFVRVCLLAVKCTIEIDIDIDLVIIDRRLSDRYPNVTTV